MPWLHLTKLTIIPLYYLIPVCVQIFLGSTLLAVSWDVAWFMNCLIKDLQREKQTSRKKMFFPSCVCIWWYFLLSLFESVTKLESEPRALWSQSPCASLCNTQVLNCFSLVWTQHSHGAEAGHAAQWPHKAITRSGPQSSILGQFEVHKFFLWQTAWPLDEIIIVS